MTVFTFDIANSCSRRALVFPKFWGLAPAAWMAYMNIYSIREVRCVCVRAALCLYSPTTLLRGGMMLPFLIMFAAIQWIQYVFNISFRGSLTCTPREYFNPPLSSESPNTTPAVTKYSPLPRRFPSLEDVTPFSDVTEKGDATFI